MENLRLLTQISALLTLLALLWLTVRAFRKHPVWGFLVLLLSPVGAAVFGIKHWSDEKKPFISYITTFSFSVILAASLFTSWGGWELLQAHKRVQEGIQNNSLSREDARAFIHTSLSFSERAGLDPEDQQQYNAMRRHLAQLDEAEQARALQEAAAAERTREELSRAMISRKVQPEKENFRLEYKPIPLADAKHYVGSTVKIIRKGVLEKEYRLTGVSGNRLQLAQRNSAGSYSFSYYTRDIERIRVLTRQPY